MTAADLGINLRISLHVPTAASEAVSRPAVVQGLATISVTLSRSNGDTFVRKAGNASAP